MVTRFCAICTITKWLQKSNRMITNSYKMVTNFGHFAQLQNGYKMVTKNYKMVTLLKHAPLPRWHARQGSAQKLADGLKKIALIDRDFRSCARDLHSQKRKEGFD